MPEKFKDLFSGHAGDYSRYRPLYPKELFKYLSSLCPETIWAWDCGTGNGQAAVELSRYFKKVTATDPSEKQLAEAFISEKVEYLKAAETCPEIPDQSLDLVTVAQAFHWFNQDLFFKEGRRVLKPNGVVAIWAYGLAHITPEVDAITEKLYAETLDGYWEKERKMIDEKYQNIYFPLNDISAPSFSMEAQWTVENWIGYLNTWSGVKAYIKKNSKNPVDNIYKDVWSPGEVRRVQWPLFLRVGYLN